MNSDETILSGDRPTTRNNRLVKLVVFAAILGVAAYVGGNGMKNAWRLQRMLDCARNMQAIVTALDQQGVSASSDAESPPALHDRIEALVARGLIKRKHAGCPVANLPESNFIIAPNVPSPENVASAAYLWEPLSNHGGEGANVVFGDGHAEFVTPEQFMLITSQSP